MQSATQVRPRLVLEVDPDSGLILSVDEQLERTLGFGRGTLVGQHVSVLSHPPTADHAGGDAVAQVFSDVTHDLVAPVNQVSSLIGLLVRKNADLASDPATGEILDHINVAVKRMRSLADGLRTVSRVLGQSMTMRSVDSGALVSAVLLNLTPEIEAAKARITVENLPFVVADNSRLMWVFQ